MFFCFFFSLKLFKNYKKANERKGGGLGDQEYGSTNYMTEALGYTYEDDGECDENTEEDLNYLKDPSC